MAVTFKRMDKRDLVVTEAMLGQNETAPSFDVIVVGAGFAGVYLVYRLRQAGYRVKVIEAGAQVGGVWYWNRYPGARCDVESLQYSYSFSKELERDWVWTERYATQPEIQAYIQHVADRFDLTRDIQFETRVSGAIYDQENHKWTISTDRDERLTANYFVLATGALSNSRVPDILGRDDFEGSMFHTGQWPREGVDFLGKRVGVIGTGSSGIQAIPLIAQQAEQLFVFQRTPHFSVPAHNQPLDDERRSRWLEESDQLRAHARNTRSGVLYDYGKTSALSVADEDRRREFEARWAKGGTNFLYAYNDIMRSDEANATCAEFVREKIRSIVKSPELAEALTPTDYPIGAKRICVDTNFYATFNRDNVTLVSLLQTPIERITQGGIRTTTSDYDLDTIVFATGFDALTGAVTAIDIRGVDGLSLRDEWAAGPYTYLGMMAAGFPNMFMITGPGSPSVLSNMVVSIEHEVDWIATALDYLKAHGAHEIQASRQAQSDWMAHVGELAAGTLYDKGNSWYLGANVPGKPRVFMPYLGGVDVYQAKCAEVARQGYTGFEIS